ncbi:LacI family DNA-binding transcriptional regulator [Actinomyces radicidentis]|uniref:LacI family DNA-binding transcriptional regulator n=1 Tax=Actinomyces radicidentis TaxID=111015 RepID=UPI0028EC8F5E|nr:LacI family DNA-binding transcriptional regulator [Actinomyces radicidentis]
MTESSPRGRRPGMMDVARLAGVSHQTVSRVINAPDSVRPGTRERVQRAIDELGYRRNMAARALVTDSTRTIGVVTASSHFFGPASTTTAIEDAARAAGYACLVSALPDDSDQGVAEVLDFLVNRGVDGVIAVAPRSSIAGAATRTARRVPLVVVADGLAPAERIHVVSVDQDLGARLAVEHLLESGRRRVAHLAGPGDWYDAVSRERGWCGALEDAGFAPGVRLEGDWSAESGARGGRELVARSRAGEPMPDAVFCANDMMALGLLSALREEGVDVPGRVAVVGFDDVDGAAWFAPPLTTVSQPFAELGRLSLEVLLEALAGAPGRAHSIAPRLEVRGSSRSTPR